MSPVMHLWYFSTIVFAVTLILLCFSLHLITLRAGEQPRVLSAVLLPNRGIQFAGIIVLVAG